jgi:4-amino-4-deoxychorismate lyase
MSLLFETIKVVNRMLVDVKYHNDRLNRTRRALFNATDQWDLAALIPIPDIDPLIKYKCKVLYEERIDHLEFIPYIIKPVRSLELVECPDLEYSYKFTDRERLSLLKGKQQSDDIIVVKNNWITDCSYANIVFFDGEKWITPSTPLLRGTKRQRYLDEKRIVEQEILVSDVKLFSKARIINAMIDLEDCPDIQIDDIF